MSRRASRIVNIEAESDDEIESSIVSEDFDNLESLEVNKSRVKSHYEFTKELEEKYAQMDESEEEMNESEVVEVSQQANLLPTPRSPLLFLVRCKIGKEKDICMRLSENVQSMEGVFSITHKDGIKGYLYIEAFKKHHVDDLLATVKFVYRNRLNVVPLKEMVEAISQEKDFVISEFARVKGGKYKGDIVQVIETYDYAVKIKAIPRIDGNKKEFDFNEHRNNTIKKDDGYYYNRDFYKDGFLIKTVLKKNLDFDVEPTFKDLKELGFKKSFLKNDVVEVFRGELKSLVGNISRINGNIAIVKVNDKEYEVSVDDIEKHYNIGDEVSYKGVNGVLLKVENNNAIVATNNFTNEIKCLVWELNKPVPEIRQASKEALPVRISRDPMVNKRVKIREGKYKGYNGIVKDVYRNRCHVQLNSNFKFISLDRSSLIPQEEPRKYGDRFSSDISKNDGAMEYLSIKESIYKSSDASMGHSSVGYKTPGFATPGLTTPGALLHTNIEESGDMCLHSTYYGTLISVKGETITVKDFKNGFFIDINENKYNMNDVSYITPKKFDQVIVLNGPYSGTSGMLLNIDGSKGKIKTNIDLSHEIDLEDLSKKAS